MQKVITQVMSLCKNGIVMIVLLKQNNILEKFFAKYRHIVLTDRSIQADRHTRKKCISPSSS